MVEKIRAMLVVEDACCSVAVQESLFELACVDEKFKMWVMVRVIDDDIFYFDDKTDIELAFATECVKAYWSLDAFVRERLLAILKAVFWDFYMVG